MFDFRLARQFTEKEDVVVTEDAFHGNLGVLIDISPKMHDYVPNYKPKDFVHITPLPSSYRRSDLISEEEEYLTNQSPSFKTPTTNQNKKSDSMNQWVAKKCASKVEQAFVEAEKNGRGVAAFICEPCFVSKLIIA